MDRLCFFLGNHPKFSLLLVILSLIPLFSYFLFNNVKIESDVRRGFAFNNGRSAEEFKRFAKFYDISYEGLEIWVILVTAKRSGNEKHLQINSELLNEIERLDQYVRNYSVKMDDGQLVRYSDLRALDVNYLFHFFKKAYDTKEVIGNLLGNINLTFPIADVVGYNLFLGSHFFYVNGNFKASNELKTAEYVALWYLSEAETFEKKKKLETLQMGIYEDSRRDDFSPLMSFWMWGDQVANAEMLRATVATVKLFTLGGAFMVIFMLYVFRHLTFKSQVMLTIGALIAPMIAFGTAASILGWIGVKFNSIMCITPFLVMGIGVDDAFLLAHCWRRCRNSLSDKERLYSVLKQVGPSMLITSATNAVAFGIGSFSPSPQMSSFCLCTAIAVSMDFVFEFLIFVPTMIIFYDEKLKKLQNDATGMSWSWKKYAELIDSVHGRVVVLVLTILLFASASVGIQKLEPSFDPSKTFPADSSLMIALKHFDRVHLEYAPLNLVVENLPRENDARGVRRLLEMTEKLEKLPHCYGRQRSQNILRDYLESKIARNLSVSYSQLPEYLEHRFMNNKTVIRYHYGDDGDVIVDGLNAVVVCRGSENWNERAKRLEVARSLVDKFPEMKVAIFDYDGTIYDLIISVKDELIKAVLLTFMCMVVACAIMIPDMVGTTVASLAMLSISYSLLGWLSIWGQDLDPVTSINVLMAVGFSVDFSAHVCHHYHMSRKIPMDMKERLAHILSSVGKPMLEASLSTLVCMFPLFFVSVYIIEAFAKTVYLVCILGMLHGMVIVPVLLSILPLPKSNVPPIAETFQPLL